VASGADAKAVAVALAGLIAQGEQIVAAAAALRQLPREAWPKEQAGAAVVGVAAWVRTIPVAQRTAPDVADTLTTADALAGLLPDAEAKAARAALNDIGVRSIAIRTVREQMRYDTKRIVVEAGKPFEIVLINEDMMPHNLAIVAPGARQEIALAAQTMRPDQNDAQGRAFMPASDKILAATKLVNPNQRQAIQLTAPTQEGDYEYVCTFPGHWTIMWGTLVVTKDPALLK
jgi:azurin